METCINNFFDATQKRYVLHPFADEIFLFKAMGSHRMSTPSSSGQILKLRGSDGSHNSLPSGMSCTGRSVKKMRGVELM